DFLAGFDEGMRLVGVVFDGRAPQRISLLILLEGALVILLVLIGLAQGEEKLDASFDAQVAALKLSLHFFDVVIIEFESLEVGEAPISAAELWKQFDRL